MLKFDNLEYLKSGNQRQRAAYNCLMSLNLFERLKQYQPLLTGTIPIEIDLPESDLDVICFSENLSEFHDFLLKEFGGCDQFSIQMETQNAVAKFKHGEFILEIFCQAIPTKEQNAYVHMIVEDKLLRFAHPKAKDEIRRLKSEGFKTEPAFALLFQLSGDGYNALLDLSKAGDDELKKIARRFR